eukprot:TRINITY_DN19838_c0_g1_i3.p1 TRINITY_DN19838_c0_g1~~TRINITY_DN19838_c0_g1_i3.p1  ORF type:complete len:454 (+),score=120.08 TRINITY_DN19838_c0_g1_i3:56-1363(+)
MAPRDEDEKPKENVEEEDDDESDNEDEENDEDSEEGSGELVAHLEEPPSARERKLLTRRNFPSKVGGKPAWLVPEHLPDVTCHDCSRPMRFLLQTYASRASQTAAAFHRVLHLFVCTNCQPNKVRAFRAQLPRQNSFYSSDPPVEEQVLKAAVDDPELWPLICWDCGLPCGVAGTSADAEAERQQEGEIEAADVVDNRCFECVRRLRNGDDPAMFSERELATSAATVPEEEDEDEAAATVAREDANGGGAKVEDALAMADAAIVSAGDKEEIDPVLMQRLKEFRERVANDPENALDGSEQQVFEEWSQEKGEKDKTFSRFQRYSAENKAHVIRYVFGGKPLWFCDKGKFISAPPPCPLCDAERVFEFQVQPQLIALLGDSELGRRLDYGTVCVFVCGESCAPRVADGDIGTPSSRYFEEFTYVQPEPGDRWIPSG